MTQQIRRIKRTHIYRAPGGRTVVVLRVPAHAGVDEEGVQQIAYDWPVAVRLQEIIREALPHAAADGTVVVQYTSHRRGGDAVFASLAAKWNALPLYAKIVFAAVAFFILAYLFNATTFPRSGF